MLAAANGNVAGRRVNISVRSFANIGDGRRRAPTFWRHHRLLFEQLATVRVSIKRRNAFVG
jgi:hypothetical protein